MGEIIKNCIYLTSINQLTLHIWRHRQHRGRWPIALFVVVTTRTFVRSTGWWTWRWRWAWTSSTWIPPWIIWRRRRWARISFLASAAALSIVALWISVSIPWIAAFVPIARFITIISSCRTFTIAVRVWRVSRLLALLFTLIDAIVGHFWCEFLSSDEFCDFVYCFFSLNLLSWGWKTKNWENRKKLHWRAAQFPCWY